ncbi:protein FAR1-RELATED SEQUENCE 5-like [Papaver somniferum]|uniref:protein FAR1-RELATED SEQUENCE 5-like n=1 Tax=Papaver somniferum TaxID=3469 RepID=UPI000E701EC6|nr:protein FAR1-RELATED SEQUENCE 5-like [Papaver somniferum]
MEEHTETPDNSTMESLESRLECLGIEPYRHEGSSLYIENHYESTGLVETDLEKPQPISPLAQESCDLMAEFSTDEVFASREEVIKWCHDKKTKTKTVVIIRKSKKKSKIQGSFIVMACERFGEYKSVNRSVEKSAVTRCLRRKPRTTGTKKCKCPFRLRATCFDGTNWRLRVLNGEHNHLPYETLTGHSFSGRLNPAEKDLCIYFSVGGVKPALILSTLKRQNKKIVSTARTIYNAKSKFRTKVMEGRTKMHNLLQLLDEHHYVTSNRREDSSGRVLELFWSHPDGSRLAQCFPTILLLDCTYKTNRWGMPLFHAVGVTSTTQSFTIAYCFMSAEKTRNYIWALERLRKLYSPNHLPSVVVTDDDI